MYGALRCGMPSVPDTYVTPPAAAGTPEPLELACDGTDGCCLAELSPTSAQETTHTITSLDMGVVGSWCCCACWAVVAVVIIGAAGRVVLSFFCFNVWYISYKHCLLQKCRTGACSNSTPRAPRRVVVWCATAILSCVCVCRWCCQLVWCVCVGVGVSAAARPGVVGSV